MPHGLLLGYLIGGNSSTPALWDIWGRDGAEAEREALATLTVYSFQHVGAYASGSASAVYTMETKYRLARICLSK
jgi:hypothetical protein